MGIKGLIPCTANYFIHQRCGQLFIKINMRRAKDKNLSCEMPSNSIGRLGHVGHDREDTGHV